MSVFETSKRIETPTHLQQAAIEQAYMLLADIRHEWPGRVSVGGQELLGYLRDHIAKAHHMDPRQVQDHYSANIMFNQVDPTPRNWGRTGTDKIELVRKVVELCDSDNGNFVFANRALTIDAHGATLRILRTIHGTMHDRRGIRNLLIKLDDEATEKLLGRVSITLSMHPTNTQSAAQQVFSLYQNSVPGAQNAFAGFNMEAMDELIEQMELIISYCRYDPLSALMVYEQITPS